jgi:hypothetical protein
VPKCAQRQLIQETFKFHQNLEFDIFFKRKLPCVEEATKHVFPYAFFNVKKRVFVCEFQHTPLCKMTFFLKVPYVLWVWDFVYMNLANLGTRIQSPSIHTYSKNWFSWPPKLCCTSWAHGKELFFQLWTLWSCKQCGMNVYVLVDI